MSRPLRRAIATTPTAMAPALLTAIDCSAHVHLIIGSNPLAGTRCAQSRAVGANAILIAPADATMHFGLTKQIEEKAVQWLQREFVEGDLSTLGREEVERVVDAVFITADGRSSASAQIAALCKRMRIPVNVVDAPHLCTFTLLSTHTSGPLQIGVTTSGRGCKLASRIRREIAAALPPDLGPAVDRLGTVRRRIWEQDHTGEYDAEDDEGGQTAAFNKLVTPDDIEAAKARRMRWLSQICEYWPLSRLAAITDDDVHRILAAYHQEAAAGAPPVATDKAAALDTPLAPTFETEQQLDSRRRPRGRIILAGAGPGHPDLLTAATVKAIRRADVVLADKLVPAAVLDMVPRRTPLHIARKFPGNADAAQDELHELGLAALKQGKTVLRLKQGDPYLYGRGAEEFIFFRAHGYIPVVLPGVTSALSAPLFAQIPPTHRAVSDQVLVCTGTGRKGAAPDPPAYRDNQTVVFLMALHRLGDLVASLTACQGGPYPASTPCAVIERASCPDQRVIRTTLANVVAAVAEEGARPPGLLVVGRACEVLVEPSPGQRWAVEEGFVGLEGLDSGMVVWEADSSLAALQKLDPVGDSAVPLADVVTAEPIVV